MERAAAQRRWDEANAQRCVLRRPLYFPTRPEDVHDRDDPSMERYYERDGVFTPSIHWTVLCDVVDYLPANMVGRPAVRCRDSAGEEFDVIGYFEGRRNDAFDRDVGPQLKPGQVLAFRYGEKKTFLDLSIGFRVEDRHVPMLKVMPGPLTKLLAAADVVFSAAADAPGCWCCKDTSATLRRCTRCKLARYCNTGCQKANWESHKQVCKYVVHIRELVGQGSSPFTLESFDHWVVFPRGEASADATPGRTEHREPKQFAMVSCDWCDKEFRTEEGRDRHFQDVHIDRECDVCGKRFDTEGARDQHREAKHFAMVSCDRCDKEFRTKEGRDRHFQDVHIDRECDVCGKRFDTEGARDQHREAKHCDMVNCDYCGREFTSEHSLHQHRQAKHVSKKTPPEPPSEPPVPDLEGEWVELSAFRGTKSFGFFTCPKCTNASTWFSAHAFPNFKQGCKACNEEILPQFLWQNAERTDRIESDKLKGPHHSERCEACRAGVCVDNY